jgi:hypothetical protein
MTGAARRALGGITVAAALVASAAVWFKSTVPKPPATVPGDSRVVFAESSTESERSSPPRSRTALGDPAMATLLAKNQTARKPTNAPTVPAAVPNRPEETGGIGSAGHGQRVVVAPTGQMAGVVASILEAPQPPQAPPPPKPAELAIEQKLSGFMGQHPGTELKFVACDEDGTPCRARVQARDLESVVAAAKATSAQYGGRVDIKIHEQPTAFNGKFYVAELQVGTEDKRPVPSDVVPYP